MIGALLALAAGFVVFVLVVRVLVKEPDVRRFWISRTSTATVLGESRTMTSVLGILFGFMLTAIGDPDSQGRIAATFVRIMPAPPSGASGTPSGAPIRPQQNQ